MAQYDKLVERLKRRPTEADFDDVRRLLEAHGWIMRKGSKHTAVFTKPGVAHRQTVPTARGRTVKRYVIDQILALLELDE